MAEVQYAPMSYDQFYAPRRSNSEPNFEHLKYFSPKSESFEARMATGPPTAADSPRNSVTSISTVSSCGSYFDSASNQSSIDPYEAEDTFSFPSYDDFNATNNDDKPTFIHLERSLGDDDEEEEGPPSSPTINSIPKIITTSAEPPVTAIDDITLREEPSRHVDYLSHEWKEEDIWASWRYMIGKRKVYDNAARLENASWRTWMKAKNNLKTVSPEKLNWMKDYDVTWLYGPLSTAPERTSFSVSPTSPECSSAPRNPCHKTTKKTILKKRSMSEVLLQRSLSSSNLLKQATASIRSQQSQNHHRLSRPVMPSRAASDYATYPFVSHTAAATTGEGTSDATSGLESGLQSPSSSRKHIHFNDRVEQCIAVEIKDEDDEMDDIMGFDDEEEEEDSDEGGLFLNMSGRPKTGSRQNSKGSISEPQTIQKLPSTTLKAEVEPTELKQSTSTNNLSSLIFGAGPVNPAKTGLGPGTAFMFNEDEDDDPIDWEPKWATRKDSLSLNRGRFGELDDEYGGFAECPPTPPSGNEGIFGRAVDAVNTARDIAHVFWNVGWASRR